MRRSSFRRIPICRSTVGRVIFVAAPRATRTQICTTLPHATRSQDVGQVKPVILVVDDEPVLRRMIARTLEAEGFAVVMASDGLEAWGLIEEGNGPFALLLVDLVMPRWDGTTLIRRVKEQQPAQRIMIITGRTEPEMLDQVSRNIPVLLKPFTPEDLTRVVRQTLRPRESAPVRP
jgi:DNA-binding response OmpR family regulator